MLEENLQLLRDVAKLYYDDNMTQAQIAQRFGLSRPKISRLLSEAREKGIVKVFISDSSKDISYIESRFLSLFNLKAVQVVSVPPTDDMLALQITAREAAKFIVRFLNEDDRIGVGWGVTLNEIAKNLQPLPLSNSIIAQLCGNLDNADTLNYANDIVNRFASKLNSKGAYTLPCPVIVGNQIILDILLHDVKLCQNMNRARSCNKMIVNIGVPTEQNCLYKSGYISLEDIARLKEQQAAGSICSHFYDMQGNICDEQLDKRTMSVSLETIKTAECAISCVVGSYKAQALLCALKAGFLDVLVVDSITAAKVLDMIDASTNKV